MVQVPKTVKESHNINRKLGGDFWTKVIVKEMGKYVYHLINFKVFQPVRQGKEKLGLYVSTSMCTWYLTSIWMGNLLENKRLVAGGHTTAITSAIAYSSVVSRESVRVVFILVSLNELEIFTCSIGNSYPNAKFREKLGQTRAHGLVMKREW